MEDLSRRKVLLGGGALGALGALRAALPAAAGSSAAWTWSPGGSVLGSGAGTDPRYVWDDVADPLVASLLERGAVPEVNRLLRQWTRNGQALPAGLPRDLHEFLEGARQLPAWADRRALRTSVDFTKKRGSYLGLVYGLGSGMMSTAIPKEARAVYYSKGGADMKDRIAKTAKLGYDIGDLKAYEPEGQMVVTAVKTRLVHAAVRHLLPQSPGWSQSSGERTPISQHDMLVTWHSLPTFTMSKLTDWRVPIPEAESEAFLHLWQVSAHMLGIRDEYIPGTWETANSQLPQVLDPATGPTREGVELAEILLSLASEMDGGASRPMLNALTRYLVGDRVADWVEIPREPVWDPMVRTSWPQYVAFREGYLPLRLAPDVTWAFDEVLRRGLLLFLSEGKEIFIEIPEGNRPS